MTRSKTVTLYCREGSSDKVYQISLRQRGDGWVVDYGNGKRGQALKNGTKTEEPVSFEQADKIYESLLKRQLGRKYTPDQSGVAYTNTEHEHRASGMTPQLPTAISREQAERYIQDPAWGLQEKRDGENRLIQIGAGDVVRGINRKGLFVEIPRPWSEAFCRLGNCLIAGEHMAGDAFDAFDLLEMRGEDLRGRPYEERFKLLVTLSESVRGLAGFRVLDLWATREGKRQQMERLLAQHAEGVVFKRLAAAFEPGRSDQALKCKFVESATCVVLRQNLQRSVAVGALDRKGNLVDLGNVTIPLNYQVPERGDLVEIQYLYRYEDGSFEQAVFKGPRSDMATEDATLAQITRIKRKSAAGVGTEALLG